MSHFDEVTSTLDNNNNSSSISDDELILASNNPKKRAGRKVFRETRHPIYRGVRRRDSGKWVCEMREPNKKSRIWLGTYPTVEMAARAHDVAAIALRGKSACLNFADSAWRLHIPASRETKDIQKAANEAAEAFRPSTKVDDEGGNDERLMQQVDDDQIGCSSSENGNGNVNEYSAYFMDDDEMYGVPSPRLITSMAEGLMMPPPFQSIDEEAQEHEHPVKLWSYSI